MAPRHPSGDAAVLHRASHLPPNGAAALLMERMPEVHSPADLRASLDKLGIAVGALNRKTARHQDARALWRSTLPVLLIATVPQRKTGIGREIAVEVGYLVYGSTSPARKHNAEAFADTFASALQDV